ncbi:MAG TPA: SIS domain-containing protein [Gammaproteobacteria bacterium]|nr:SIS domain-containing protein [Gammaproteobacteria bacterium]
MKQKLDSAIAEHVQVLQQVESLLQPIEQATDMIKTAFSQGNKVMACGNGGSASDAQHFASELTGRFELDRKGYAAFSLTTDTSALTAIGNDYGFNRVFARQLESIGHEDDVLLVISTSGNSDNLLETVAQAKKQQIKTIGLLGRDGGKLKDQVDVSIVVDGNRTSRIQEAHIFVLHFICQHFEV